ncbi:MAG: enoyl-CoA hydratase/isomerase family protein [Deltaproteobacteria bacterium]|nr:enoyl-CoA hydratase/isomerase family protein [Deltaproteobacteria bacterium]
MNDVIEIKRDGNIAEIILNRKEAYNAFNLEMVTLLAKHLSNMAVDNAVRGIILTGNGHSFCAGGDLKWVVTSSEKPGHSFRTLASQFHLAVTEIRRMKKPVVAALNGIAAGGGFSLALACDFRIMEKSATFKQAYTANGLSIDGGGTFTLPRIVGSARALEIAAFDAPISAKQALEWGLATKVVENGASLEESVMLLRQLAAKSSLFSFGWSKRLINDSFNNSFESHIEWEREGLSDCSESADGQEGLKAFNEKRRPSFLF